jgi:hypothetical protein
LSLSLFELAELQALLGEGLPIGYGVGDFDLILESAIGLLWIERLADAPARVLSLVAAEPFRHEFDHHIGDGARDGDHQDDVSPGRESSRLGGVDHEGDVDREQHKAEEGH